MAANEPKSPKEHLDQLSTYEERVALYNEWLFQLRAEGQLEAEKLYQPKARGVFFAQWIRWLVEQGKLTPDTSLPPYAQLAELPFHLSTYRIGAIIRQLRVEGILSHPHKKRCDTGQLRWKKRDEEVLHFIGEMHAVRFDQLQRLLARSSEKQTKNAWLSQSRTCEIIDRYERAKLVVYRRISHHSSGWVYLTRKGLQHAELPYRATPPHQHSHLYWINEVRMKLEEHYPQMRWISERSIRAQQQRRVLGQTVPHPPDGILVLPNDDGTEEQIDIEVQVSKPVASQVARVMGRAWTSGSSNPLWYFVTKEARATVRAVYKKLAKNFQPMRPAISIIDLESWITTRHDNKISVGY